VFFVQVTVHRDNRRINNPQDAASVQNFMQVMWPLPRKRPHNLHETSQLPRVQLITPDDEHRCPKHVEFRDKIKFWILDASCSLFIRQKRCFTHIKFIKTTRKCVLVS
jgi:hypothetical protein